MNKNCPACTTDNQLPEDSFDEKFLYIGTSTSKKVNIAEVTVKMLLEKFILNNSFQNRVNKGQ